MYPTFLIKRVLSYVNRFSKSTFQPSDKHEYSGDGDKKFMDKKRFLGKNLAKTFFKNLHMKLSVFIAFDEIHLRPYF
jgi:hypothetical protein